VRPLSRGYLRIRSTEPNGPLEIQPNFLAEQADVDALASGVEVGLELASQPAYLDLIKRWIVPAKRMSREHTVEFCRQTCQSYLHPVGTCAIGQDREAVVDSELRVRGVDGLRIADASVMPTIPAGNTNAASVMVGEFASRLLTGVRIRRAVPRNGQLQRREGAHHFRSHRRSVARPTRGGSRARGDDRRIWLVVCGRNAISSRTSPPKGADYSWLLASGDHHDHS